MQTAAMNSAHRDDPGRWKRAFLWGAIITISLRLGLGLVMGATWIAVRQYLPPAGGFSVYGKLSVPTSPPGDFLLGVWPRWDGVHYLNLAMRGYFDVSVGDSVFYPLYPLMTRGLAELSGGDYILAGLAVSTLSTFFLFALLYRLAESLLGTASARWATIVLALFPTAVFLIAPFTESLFLALTLGAFLAAYHRRWWAVGVLGFLASLTRGPGMLSAAAFTLIAWDQWRTAEKPRRVSQYLPVVFGLLLPVLGGLSFLVWRSLAGFPSMSDVLTRYSGFTFVDPVSGLIFSIRQWISVHDLPTTLDLASIVLFLLLSLFMILRPRWRRPDWLAYTLLNLILFLSKKSEIASSVQSASRYVLVLFPVFIQLGDALAARSPRIKFLYVVFSGSLLILFSTLYALWFFIG